MNATATAFAWRARLPAIFASISASHLSAAPVYAAGALVTYALKSFFSGAAASELRWVLGPTCWLAARLGGMTFLDEGAAGFISHDDRIVVGAACSGVNFLIVCFAALFFGQGHRFGRVAGRPGWLALWLLGSLLLATAATVCTNAVRVVVAARLFRADIYQGWLTPGRAHRIMGALLYCGSLVVVHGVVGRLLRRRPAVSGRLPSCLPSWLLASPLVWYLAIAVVVPVFRLRSDSADARLAEHLLTVAGVAGLLALVVVVARTLTDRLRSRAVKGPPAS